MSNNLFFLIALVSIKVLIKCEPLVVGPQRHRTGTSLGIGLVLCSGRLGVEIGNSSTRWSKIFESYALTNLTDLKIQELM